MAWSHFSFLSQSQKLDSTSNFPKVTVHSNRLSFVGLLQFSCTVFWPGKFYYFGKVVAFKRHREVRLNYNHSLIMCSDRLFYCFLAARFVNVVIGASTAGVVVLAFMFFAIIRYFCFKIVFQALSLNTAFLFVWWIYSAIAKRGNPTRKCKQNA